MAGTAASNPLTLRLAHSGVLAADDFPVLKDLCAEARDVPAKTVLVAQSERTKGVHLVVDGFAYRYRILSGGRRQILGLLLPGDFCDLQAGLLSRSDHYTATVTPARIAYIPQSAVDDLTLSNSRIARALWWSTLVDESILRTWLTNMGQHEADVRLAHFLSEFLLRMQIVSRAEGDTCGMPFTQEEIGDMLGISSVHVNRVLMDLRGCGLLHLEGRRLTVPEVAKLWAFCGFEPDYLHLSAG